ncbi:MAG: dockerin type I domain-containing protein [Planctomycetota bacterium]
MPTARSASVLAALAACSPVLADSEAFFNTPAGTTITVTMSLTITTSLGTSSDSDTKVIATTGSAYGVLAPTDPAWTGVTLDQVHFALANTTFHFDLYCFPFIGCQSLDVALSNMTIDSVAPMSSPVSATGQAAFTGAQFRIVGSYVTTGVSASSGVIDSVSSSNFACRLSALPKSQAKLDQLSMSSVTTVVDPASLPAGVTALTITFTPAFGTASMVGPWSPIVAFDLNGDGVVNAVDLAELLAQWGGPGTADFDGDGAVNAPDLAALLGAWG